MNRVTVTPTIVNETPKFITGRLYQYVNPNGIYNGHVYHALKINGNERLFSLNDGGVWSSVSPFGSTGERFILLPVGTEVTITVQE